MPERPTMRLRRCEPRWNRPPWAVSSHGRTAPPCALDRVSERDALMKQLLTMQDNEAQRESDQKVNQNGTVRALLSLRTAEVETGAEAAQAAIERDTAIAEKLIERDK